MPVEKLFMYRIECGWVGCRCFAHGDAEYHTWKGEGEATDVPHNAGWLRALDGDWYCPKHPVVHEHDQDSPPAPYLMVRDDGLVELIIRLSPRDRKRR